MHIRMRFLLGTLVFSIGFLGITPLARAFSVAPAVRDVVMSAGDDLVQSLQVSNTSDVPVVFKINVRTFQKLTEGGAPVMDAVGEESPVAGWVFVPAKGVEVPAHSTKPVGFSIKAPVGAEPGSYFFGLFVQQVSSELGEKPTVAVVTEVGSLWSVTVRGEVILQGEVRDFAFAKNDGAPGKKIQAQFSNQGTVVWRPQGVVVGRLFGAEIGRSTFNTEAFAVLPGSGRPLFGALNKDFLPFFARVVPLPFTLELEVPLPQGALSKNTLTWWFFEWTQGVSAIFVLLTFSVFVNRKMDKRRKRKFEQALSKGKMLVFFVCVLVGLLGGESISYAVGTVTSTQGVSVNATVPAPPEPSAPPPPPPPPPPAAPNTTIAQAPATRSNIQNPQFVFTSTVAGSTFECSLDGAAFAACASPQNYANLLEGQHTFQVRATASGQTDGTPASHTWIIDITPPVVVNVQATVSETSATITWTSEAGAVGIVRRLRVNGQAENNGVDFNATEGPAGVFTVQANNLNQNTQYVFSVRSTDIADNQTNVNGNFTTLTDTTPPANPTNFNATPGNATITLGWTNPTTQDYRETRLVRKTGGFPANPSDGVQRYLGGDSSFVDTNLQNGIQYFYALFAYDNAGNSSSGVLASATPVAPVAACADGVDNDGDDLIDLADSGCANAADADETNPAPLPPQCDDDVDNDNDGLVDFPNDPGCTNLADVDESNTSPVQDEGANGDDGVPQNGGDPQPDQGGAVIQQPNATEVPPVVVPGVTVAQNQKLLIDDFDFSLMERTVRAQVNDRGQLRVFPALSFSVRIAAEKIKKPVEQMVMNFLSDSFLIAPTKNSDAYIIDLLAPTTIGSHGATIIVRYKDGTSDVVQFTVAVEPQGQVLDKKSAPLADAIVELIVVAGNKETLWQGVSFKQKNPQQTNSQGIFGFVVEPGTYKLRVFRSGFLERSTLSFVVDNNLVARTIEMIAEPKKIQDIDFEEPVTKVAAQVAQSLKEQAVVQTQIVAETVVEVGKKAVELADNVQVEEAAEKIVAPATIGVVVASALPSIQLMNIVPFLRFVFLQPLFLLGRRKRKGWGVIYNALNKQPLDLVMVRLIDAKTGRLVQSRVTDGEGRYAFLAAPGEYRIEVRYRNFLFPSQLLGTQREDRGFVDLYHGELVKVQDSNTLVTPNIPLDPPDAPKKPVNLVMRLWLRRLQSFAAFLGFLLTVVVMIVKPSVVVGAMLGVHIVLYVVFKRIAVPRPPKNWGIVYDVSSRTPLGRVVARIFDVQYNKLLETQLTDTKGRYAFLVGQNKYYVTFEKQGYKPKKSDVIDLAQEKERESVGLNVGLEPVTFEPHKSDVSATPTPTA